MRAHGSKISSTQLFPFKAVANEETLLRTAQVQLFLKSQIIVLLVKY